MKKFLLIGSIFAFTAISSAAQINWSVAISHTDSFSVLEGATAYLIQSTGDATIEQIAQTLSTTGIPSGDIPSNFTYYGSTTDITIEADISYFMDNYLRPVDDPSTTNGFFTLILNADGTFAISSFVELTSFGVSGDYGNGYNAVFTDVIAGDMTWTTGTLGGGTIDPDVPEPTALALLTLGVAGVALRRRIR